VTNNNAVVLNVWQHIAVTWDGTNQGTGIHIYTDGIEQAYQETGNDGTGVSDVGVPLTIGNRNENDRTFDGLIDDVRIYNRVITASEVWSLYADPFLEFRGLLLAPTELLIRSIVARFNPIMFR